MERGPDRTPERPEDTTPHESTPADETAAREQERAERAAAAEERRSDRDRRVVERPVEHDQRVEVRRVTDVERTSVEQRQYVLTRIGQAVDYLFYLLYGLLLTRFLLALLGASEQAGFVRFINGITEPFYAPFSGIVGRPAVNGGFMDFPVIIALLGYALLHFAVRGLIRVIAGTPRTV